ncbi:pirin family protein [Nitratireductor sp. GCM10026969]|uniref:pirin family protein n=1 Tax=Nitratireductor sp. GCM10026969 TaxID=3252645 RepID=UPI00360A16CD
MTRRNVASIRPAPRHDVGSLFSHLPISDPTDRQLDPFLILGHHGPQVFEAGNHGMPFDDHPHRGFETVTFILDGSLVHSDSSGHHRAIEKGGVQWMTAGSGVIHNEQVPPAFRKEGGSLEILQLWVNLPSNLKWVPPRYTGVQRDTLPAVPLPSGAATLNLVAGQFGETIGPIDSLTGIFMSNIELRTGAHVELPVPRGRTILFYIVRGNVVIEGHAASQRDLVIFGDDGDTISFEAGSDALVLFAHGDPIGEPVAARGPFVMNTDEEIEQAFRDYRTGAFKSAETAEIE